MRDCSYRDPRGTQRCTECGAPLDLCHCEEPDDVAHERLWTAEGRTMTMIRNEVEKALESGIGPRHLLAQLNAEIGQINYQFYVHDDIARTQGETGEQGVTAEEVYRSLVRACSLAIRLAIAGDPNFAYEPLAIFGEESLTQV